MKNKSAVICLSVAVGVFVVLAVLATLFDLQVSNLLADVESGEYYSSNFFACALEVFGEIPLYLFLAYAIAVLFWNAYYFGKTWVKYSLGLFCVIAMAVVCYAVPSRVHEYLTELKISLVKNEKCAVAVNVIIASFLGLIAFFAVMFTGKDNVKKQLSFALVVIFTAACSQLFTQGLKAVNKRVRFRTMNVLGDFSMFTPWYSINGYPLEYKELVDFFGSTDCIRSFPSGHTTAAGITYSLIALPYVVKKFESKSGKALFYGISVSYTGLVAVSRIVMGAHYFSDVLFGGSAAFLCAMVAVWLIYKKKAIKPLVKYCDI